MKKINLFFKNNYSKIIIIILRLIIYNLFILQINNPCEKTINLILKRDYNNGNSPQMKSIINI